MPLSRACLTEFTATPKPAACWQARSGCSRYRTPVAAVAEQAMLAGEAIGEHFQRVTFEAWSAMSRSDPCFFLFFSRAIPEARQDQCSLAILGK